MTQIPHDLMTAILDNTASDLPRLIVADWLEEHGESERSEFIRVQIELANHPHYQHITTKNYDARDGVNEEWQRGFDLQDRIAKLWNFGMPGTWVDSIKPSFDCIQCIDSETISIGTSRDPIITYRRGFPNSVRCTMADFMPGECEKCNGKGVLAGYPNALSFSSCGPCHGTGKSPFLAAVIGGWPVARIEFSDRQPMAFFAGDSPWRWLHVDYVSDNIPQRLPGELFKLLKPHGRGWGHDNTEAFYPTRELAISALSDAAVRYARGEWEASIR